MTQKTQLEIETLSQQTESLANVINNEPDMACVLITGAFLDQCLASLLRRYLVKSGTVDTLLNPNGNLGTFASRVKMCYCLSLITKGMLQNFDTIGEIRNLFGHTHLSLDFTDPDIIVLCNKLTFPKIHHVITIGETANSDPFIRFQGPRNRFSTITFMLANRLLLTGLSTKHLSRLDSGWE